MSDRLPPKCLDAEKAILAAILNGTQPFFGSKSLIADLLRIIKTESFFTSGHQKLFAACVVLWQSGQPVGFDSLLEHLRKGPNLLEDCGGAGFLYELSLQPNQQPLAAISHARMVHDAWVLREIIHISTELMRRAYDADPLKHNTPDSLLTLGIKRLASLL